MLNPSQHGMMSAASLKKHGSKPVFTALRHYEVGTIFLSVSRNIIVYFFAAQRPGVCPINIVLEAAFIKIDNVFCAVLRDPCA
jgi:hypothetical protein